MNKTKVDYSQTYWSHKGKHEHLCEQLNKLVLSSGEVEDHENNPALETFRVASNCYYDLYNNGLGNRGKQFEEVFGFSAFDVGEDLNGFSVELTQELIDRTEAKMDEFVVLAAHEQGIGETKAETIDITPVGCSTPEGAKRVHDAMNKIESANARVADMATRMVDRLAANLQWDSEENDELKDAVEYRKGAYDELLRAVAGR